jgi:hypothetical protein
MLEKENVSIEKTVLVGIVTQNQSEEKLREYLDELEFLTYTTQKPLLEQVKWTKFKTILSQTIYLP